MIEILGPEHVELAGLFGGILGGIFGGGSSSTSVNTSSVTNVDVEVNPQIAVGVDVDTAPIADVIARQGEEADADRDRIADVLSNQGEALAGLREGFDTAAAVAVALVAGILIFRKAKA